MPNTPAKAEARNTPANGNGEIKQNNEEMYGRVKQLCVLCAIKVQVHRPVNYAPPFLEIIGGEWSTVLFLFPCCTSGCCFDSLLLLSLLLLFSHNLLLHYLFIFLAFTHVICLTQQSVCLSVPELMRCTRRPSKKKPRESLPEPASSEQLSAPLVLSCDQQDGVSLCTVSVEESSRVEDMEVPPQPSGPQSRYNRMTRADPNGVVEGVSPREGAKQWRLQLRQRGERADVGPGVHSGPSNDFDGSQSVRSLTSETPRERDRRPVTSVKSTMETQEEQLEMYRVLQERQFTTLHEELQHLRVSYVGLHKTLSRKNEEVLQLQNDINKKKREIERLNALVQSLRRRSPEAEGAREEDRAMTARGDGAGRIIPSLALFAASRKSGLANNTNGGGGPPAKMLLELRQNIASRDTVIDRLRIEMGALQNSNTEKDVKIKRLEEELEKARSECAKLLNDIAVAKAPTSSVQNGAPSTANDFPIPTDISAGCGASSSKVRDEIEVIRHQLEDYRKNFSADDNTTEHIGRKLQQLEQVVPPTYASGADASPQPHQWPLHGGMRDELDHLRRCLEREKDASADMERQWRRRREADMRMAEAELSSARAETEVFRRELVRLQQQLAISNFADAQLQTARNENDALQQRVHELREENMAQASREVELRNSIRSLRESCERHEDELLALQRRLKVTKESESRLREEVSELEERLARVEEAAEHAGSPPPDELNSYMSLLSLNTELQNRVKALEDEIQQTKKTVSATSTEGVEPEDSAGGCPIAAIEAAAARSDDTKLDDECCELFDVEEKRDVVAAVPPDSVEELQDRVCSIMSRLSDCEEELRRSREQLSAAESEVAILRQQKDACVEKARETVQRKVSSLRAAREEALHYQEQLKKQSMVILDLQQQCKRKQELLESVGKGGLSGLKGMQRAPCPSCNGANSDCVDVVARLEEQLIEEALREESMRVDAELEALRTELASTQMERDQWKMVATLSSRAVGRGAVE
ncbi:hypothetical protein TRVL_01871 [Trypanosoma vivax]|nr:hypothetical protein TRVL_01871 [Trypanosoma vivax]